MAFGQRLNRAVIRTLGVVLLAYAGSSAVSLKTMAQEAKAPEETKKPATKSPAGKAKAKLPPVETVEMVTSDGVRLQADYYKGTNGKKTVPIIIVHSSKTDRNGYRALALALQNAGHAVIIPDLRGYGESTKLAMGGEISKEKLPPAEYGKMVAIDMVKTKQFLRFKNNAGELNLNQLCVIGVGDLGSVVAVNFAFFDWFLTKEYPRVKMSKDVRGLIIVSPEPNFKILQFPKPLQALMNGQDTSIENVAGDPEKSTQRLSMFFVAGAGKPGAKSKPAEWRSAKSYADQVAKVHPEVERNAEELRQNQTVFFGEMPTSLQGPDLLKGEQLQMQVSVEPFEPNALQAMIELFIDWRLTSKLEDFPWSERKLPGE